MIKFNNEQMLTDKTQFLNRLQDSTCTVKTNLFGHSIKSPYLAQYKIFEERLKNPKNKTMSMVMRKRKFQEHSGKQNLLNQLKLFEQQHSLQEARKILNNQSQKFTLFSTNTIDYDVNENSRQSEVMLKFKQKLNDMKMIKHQFAINDKSRISTLSFVTDTQKHQRTEMTSSVGSQRTKCNQLKPLTVQMFNRPRGRMVFKERQSFNSKINEKQLKPSLTFITYKRNKTFVQKFTKDKDKK